MEKESNQRVIAAVRSEEDFEAVAKSPARMVFLLQGNICKLSEQCRMLREAGKQVFLHMDLVDGLKGDDSGMKFASREFHLTGIISTKATCLKLAKEVGLLAIQRVFMLDTSALKTGVLHAKNCKPDFVEVLPGISPQIIRLAVKEFQVPIIAGGLISNWEDVEGAISAGAAAVSSSHRELWTQSPERSHP
ncbi:MAG: glycerol-3-phosphate responsive antiterminator [Victivallales bacterium]|nr:glycerol-3-phosphate responsive antiterminator [Victivallales bacterium]